MLLPFIITGILFVGGFALKSAYTKLCVLCFSIAGTWITLILLSWFRLVPLNEVAVGIYMGGSAVGLIYYLGSKSESFSFFKLPILMTLIFLSYALLLSWDIGALLILALTWAFFTAIYSFSGKMRLKAIAQKIVECCRNW